MEDVLEKFICKICGWIYDPEKGDISQGISEGTPFQELSENSYLHSGHYNFEVGPADNREIERK